MLQTTSARVLVLPSAWGILRTAQQIQHQVRHLLEVVEVLRLQVQPQALLLLQLPLRLQVQAVEVSELLQPLVQQQLHVIQPILVRQFL